MFEMPNWHLKVGQAGNYLPLRFCCTLTLPPASRAQRSFGGAYLGLALEALFCHLLAGSGHN